MSEIKQIKLLSYDGKLEEMLEEIKQELINNFEIPESPSWSVNKKVYDSFGYKIDRDDYCFNKLNFEPEKMKWGFVTKEFAIIGESNFEPTFLVASREEMDEIVEETYENRDVYLTSLIAKMHVLGITHVLMNKEEEMRYTVWFDKDCSSRKKKHSVSHIYISPMISGGFASLIKR